MRKQTHLAWYKVAKMMVKRLWQWNRTKCMLNSFPKCIKTKRAKPIEREKGSKIRIGFHWFVIFFIIEHGQAFFYGFNFQDFVALMWVVGFSRLLVFNRIEKKTHEKNLDLVDFTALAQHAQWSWQMCVVNIVYATELLDSYAFALRILEKFEWKKKCPFVNGKASKLIFGISVRTSIRKVGCPRTIVCLLVFLHPSIIFLVWWTNVNGNLCVVHKFGL